MRTGISGRCLSTPMLGSRLRCTFAPSFRIGGSAACSPNPRFRELGELVDEHVERHEGTTNWAAEAFLRHLRGPAAENEASIQEAAETAASARSILS